MERTTNDINAPTLERALVKSADPKWLVFIGAVLTILGLVALYGAVATTFFSVLFVGALLIVSAVAQIVAAFQSRGWKSFTYHLLTAVLYGLAGLLMTMNPLAGAVFLTAVLAFTLFCGGLVRLASAFLMRFRNWGWAAFSGVVTLALAVYLLAMWPAASVVALGVFVGVDLFFMGVYMVIVGASMPAREIDEPRRSTIGDLVSQH